MEQVKYEEMSNIFKALSDSNRIKIVDLLYKNGPAAEYAYDRLWFFAAS